MKESCSFRVALFQPEIPANTGNIGRLCVGINAQLHIIKPMRFLLTDKYLKRAGLDYWDKLSLHFYENLEDLINTYSKNNIYFCTTKSNNIYTNRDYKQGDIFVFGPETRGIPESILEKYWEQTIKIPMSENIRSINLSNSVAIVLYEALRQVTIDNYFLKPDRFEAF
ncbi:MAG: tRNA (cytidine(34)-2'-O)-methyltransferase [Candidatus Cloacimonetes bacterium]|nr:tRNA (cytidine(34)-2'-O)-methyltransferase [Candidatus Cloacimonadota bacterium]